MTEEQNLALLNSRSLPTTVARRIASVALILAALYAIASSFRPFLGVSLPHMGMILAFSVPAILLSYPMWKGEKRSWTSLLRDILLSLMAIAIGVRLVLEQGYVDPYRVVSLNTVDWVFGVAVILIIMDGSRRSMGNTVPIVAVIGLIYCFIGGYIPGFLGHPGYGFEHIVANMYLGENSIFGLIFDTITRVVFPILLYGGILVGLGAGQFLIDVSLATIGRYRGGPAKAAVISSAMFGTISGSAVANAATTGAFTIPLMKSTGYKAHFAGAVEAAASFGGQIMPPMLGWAAFIMVELLGIPYLTLIIAAAVPGVLYFFLVYMMVDSEALKEGLKGVSSEYLPNLRNVLKKGGHFFVSPLVLIYCLAVPQYSVQYSIFWTILSAVTVDAIVQFVRTKRYDIKPLVRGIMSGALNACSIALIAATIGIILGTFDLTALGIKLTQSLTVLAGQSVFLMLVMAMFAGLILGTGLPSILAYLFVALIIAPTIVAHGFSPLGAHLFAFWFAMIHTLTPPVALVCVVTAKMADAPFLRVAQKGMQLGLASYFLPFVWMYNPALILEGTLLEIVFVVACCIVAIIAFTGVMEGYLFGKKGWLQRLLLAIAGGLLVIGTSGAIPQVFTFIGFGLVAFDLLPGIRQWWVSRREKRVRQA